MIDDYEFHLELITQLPTSMHGSKEGHMAYIYRRPMTRAVASAQSVSCDPLFQPAWDLINNESLDHLKSHVREKLTNAMETNSGRATRSSRTPGR